MLYTYRYTVYKYIVYSGLPLVEFLSNCINIRITIFYTPTKLMHFYYIDRYVSMCKPTQLYLPKRNELFYTYLLNNKK